MEDLIKELSVLLNIRKLKFKDGFIVNYVAYTGLATDDYDGELPEDFRLDIYDSKGMLHKLVGASAGEFQDFLKDVYDTVHLAKYKLYQKDYSDIEALIVKIKGFRD